LGSLLVATGGSPVVFFARRSAARRITYGLCAHSVLGQPRFVCLAKPDCKSSTLVVPAPDVVRIIRTTARLIGQIVSILPISGLQHTHFGGCKLCIESPRNVIQRILVNRKGTLVARPGRKVTGPDLAHSAS
jgi:hypothetical protein